MLIKIFITVGIHYELKGSQENWMSEFLVMLCEKWNSSSIVVGGVANGVQGSAAA